MWFIILILVTVGTYYFTEYITNIMIKPKLEGKFKECPICGKNTPMLEFWKSNKRICNRCAEELKQYTQEHNTKQCVVCGTHEDLTQFPVATINICSECLENIQNKRQKQESTNQPQP